MKIFKSKFISVLLLLIMSLTLLNGCYFVKSGKPKQIQGTYSLSHYSGKSDYIAESSINMLMVLDGSGTGYYAYKDNDTESFVSELKYTLEADEEESGKYSYISIDFGNGEEAHRMAVNADWKSTKFNSQRAVWDGNLLKGDLTLDYYIDVDFERVDKSTDLSYISKYFDTSDIYAFGTRVIGGAYSLTAQDIPLTTDDYSAEKIASPFIYLYIYLNLEKDEATVWYSLKSDSKLHKDSYSLTAVNNGSVAITIDGVEMIGKFESKMFFIPYSATIQNEGEDARDVTAYIPLYFDGSLSTDRIDTLVVEKIEAFNAANEPSDDTE